jgi:hypothetical protein
MYDDQEADMPELRGWLLVALFLTPAIAQSQYLDPGSGSYLFQALISFGTILIFFIVRFRAAMGAFLRRTFRRGSTE